MSLEPEEEADGLDSVRTSADDPSQVAEELNEPILNAQSSMLHTEEIQQVNKFSLYILEFYTFHADSWIL